MEVHSGAASARAATVVTGVQRADCRHPRPSAQSAASFTVYLLPHRVFRQIQSILLKKYISYDSKICGF